MFSKAGRRTLIVATIATAGLSPGCAVTRGDLAPEWMLRDTKGVEHSMSDYRGRVVVLDFWATWCSPCHEVSPHMQAMHERYGEKDVAILAIHYNDRGAPAAYMKKHGYRFKALTDGLAVAKKYGVSRIPTIMVISRDGRVLHRQTGFGRGDEKNLARIVEEARKSRVPSDRSAGRTNPPRKT